MNIGPLVLVVIYWIICILAGFMIAQLASLATTIYLHRGTTHRAITFHPFLEFLFQLDLWLTTGINRKEWEAVHLCHHAHADVEGDPHSPLILGFWKVQLFNAFFYWRATRDPKVLWYARHRRPVGFEKIISRIKGSGLIGLSIGVGVVLLCLALGIKTGLIIAFFHTLFYVFFLNNLVNGWCHYRGYKNYPKVVAFNNRFIAWITMGEGLHNNHHHSPTNPKLSHRPDEFDPGWAILKKLISLGLARIERPDKV